MAESSPARRPVPLIESGKTRRPRRPRPGRGPLPAAAPAPDPTPRLPAELYFLIARYLSAGPCRRAAQVSAGPRAAAALRGSRPRRRLGSREEVAWRTRGAAPAPLTARIFGCRCWCRSWSSTRFVLRGGARPAASPASPAGPARGPLARLPRPPPPRPPPGPARWSLVCVSGLCSCCRRGWIGRATSTTGATRNW